MGVEHNNKKGLIMTMSHNTVEEQRKYLERWNERRMKKKDNRVERERGERERERERERGEGERERASERRERERASPSS